MLGVTPPPPPSAAHRPKVPLGEGLNGPLFLPEYGRHLVVLGGDLHERAQLARNLIYAWTRLAPGDRVTVLDRSGQVARPLEGLLPGGATEPVAVLGPTMTDREGREDLPNASLRFSPFRRPRLPSDEGPTWDELARNTARDLALAFSEAGEDAEFERKGLPLLEALLLALCFVPGADWSDVPRVLRDRSARHLLLRHLADGPSGMVDSSGLRDRLEGLLRSARIEHSDSYGRRLAERVERALSTEGLTTALGARFGRGDLADWLGCRTSVYPAEIDRWGAQGSRLLGTTFLTLLRSAYLRQRPRGRRLLVVNGFVDLPTPSLWTFLEHPEWEVQMVLLDARIDRMADHPLRALTDQVDSWVFFRYPYLVPPSSRERLGLENLPGTALVDLHPPRGILLHRRVATPFTAWGPATAVHRRRGAPDPTKGPRRGTGERLPDLRSLCPFDLENPRVQGLLRSLEGRPSDATELSRALGDSLEGVDALLEIAAWAGLVEPVPGEFSYRLARGARLFQRAVAGKHPGLAEGSLHTRLLADFGRYLEAFGVELRPVNQATNSARSDGEAARGGVEYSVEVEAFRAREGPRSQVVVNLTKGVEARRRVWFVCEGAQHASALAVFLERHAARALRDRDYAIFYQTREARFERFPRGETRHPFLPRWTDPEEERAGGRSRGPTAYLPPPDGATLLRPAIEQLRKEGKLWATREEIVEALSPEGRARFLGPDGVLQVSALGHALKPFHLRVHSERVPKPDGSRGILTFFGVGVARKDRPGSTTHEERGSAIVQGAPALPPSKVEAARRALEAVRRQGQLTPTLDEIFTAIPAEDRRLFLTSEGALNRRALGRAVGTCGAPPIKVWDPVLRLSVRRYSLRTA